jgi:hypothetical protein
MLTDRMTWCSFNASLDPCQRRYVKRTGQSRCSGVLFEHLHLLQGPSTIGLTPIG